MAFKGIIFDPPDNMNFGLVVNSSESIPDRGYILYQDLTYVVLVDNVYCLECKEIDERLYEIYDVHYSFYKPDCKAAVLSRNFLIYYYLGKAYKQ